MSSWQQDDCKGLSLRPLAFLACADHLRARTVAVPAPRDHQYESGEAWAQHYLTAAHTAALHSTPLPRRLAFIPPSLGAPAEAQTSGGAITTSIVVSHTV